MATHVIIGCVLSCVLVLTATGVIADDRTAVEGTWLNGAGDGWIELRIDGEELRGHISGSPDDPLNQKPSRLDASNPDESLRNRELRGLVILSGFRYEDSGRWSGGRIYDPNSGNTYRGTITLTDRNTLKLRGYIGVSLFGRTETWRRKAEP